MKIIRTENKDLDPVFVNKRIFDDSRLSLKAKGLLSYLTTRPENSKIHIESLYRKSVDGYDSIKSAIRELKLTGYLELNRGVGLKLHEEPLFSSGFRSNENINKPWSKEEIILETKPIKN